MRYNKNVALSKIGTIIDYKELDDKVSFIVRCEDIDYNTEYNYDASLKSSYICRDAVLEIIDNNAVIKQVIM